MRYLGVKASWRILKYYARMCLDVLSNIKKNQKVLSCFRAQIRPRDLSNMKRDYKLRGKCRPYVTGWLIRWCYPHLQTPGLNYLHLHKHRALDACRSVKIKLIASWLWAQGEYGGYFLVSAAFNSGGQPTAHLPSLQPFCVLRRSSPTGGLDNNIIEFPRLHTIRHTSSRTSLNEAATYTTDTGNGHPCLQQDTNPRSQKSSGCRPSP